ncbi:DUF418 domain-containing protein [Actinotalea sp. K2]|uniref:DUF418 domain-containing protein n=1 Tax=Actinotalea sp. K2 TaxID=2939438 RepID=UPI002017E56C|nr:DUF418 domain-containing protein [Actinotalea sp. K2]MCL3859747.1 DUF418 domain-containing protein [Actinotalea sp. K2]
MSSAASGAVEAVALERPASITRAERSLAPDIARGAMLLFIAVANVGMYLWGRGLDEYGNAADAVGVDRLAHALEQLLMAERSRPMFAILYGFGIAVMASRMAARGVDPRGVRRVLRRRSWWLVALGVLHAGLLFSGDILAAYGASGLIVLGLVQLSGRALRRWLWGTLVFVALVGLPGFAVMLSMGSTLDEGLAAGEHPAGSGYLSHVVHGLATSAGGMVFAVLLMAYLPLMIGGIMLRRAGWLDRPADNLVVLRRVFVSGMVVNLTSSLPVTLIALGVWQPGTGTAVVATWVTLLGGMYAGWGYICGFALLAHRWSARGRRGLPGALAALGERSLTGYLGQSLLMAPLLSPWGLALGDGLGYLGAYAIAVGAWLTTLVLAVVLERRGLRGPFEVLLRRLTYGPSHGSG